MTIKKIIKKILPDRVLDFVISITLYYSKVGKFPRLFKPQTLNEKILHRKLFDRRDILTMFADKYEVRNYVAEKIGEQYLTQLYFVTENPEDIPFEELPKAFVVKPTHGSGWIRVVNDKSTLDKEELILQCKKWLNSSFYDWTREWQYKNIKPRIIIEEFISDNGKVPIDYKFFVFHGKVEFIQIDIDRYGEHRSDVYSGDWKKFDVLYTIKNIEGHTPKPPHFEEMKNLAVKLCEGFDFLRVDFYDTEKIYFGEITATPGNSVAVFDPPEFDDLFGKMWKWK